MRASTGFRLDSGVQGIHPGVHQPSGRYCVVICGFGGGLHAGWTPKKTALSLAICRASPASIRFRPERNRKLVGTGPRPDSQSQPGCPSQEQPRFARAHDPEYIAMDTVRGAIRLAARCLDGKCLAQQLRLDRHYWC